MVSQRWLRIWIIQKIHFGEGVLLAIFNNVYFVSLRGNNKHEFDQDRKEFENGKAFNGFSWFQTLWGRFRDISTDPLVKNLKPNQQGAKKIKNTSNTALA